MVDSSFLSPRVNDTEQCKQRILCEMVANTIKKRIDIVASITIRTPCRLLTYSSIINRRKYLNFDKGKVMKQNRQCIIHTDSR